MDSDRHEDRGSACKLLLDMLREPHRHFSAWGPEKPWLDLLEADLLHKTSDLPAEVAKNFLQQGIWHGVPSAVGSRIGAQLHYEPSKQVAEPDRSGSRRTKKLKCDVAILTVIDVEFEAASRVFNAAINDTEPLRIRNREYREFRLSRGTRSDIVGYIVKCGRPRNVSMANLCRDVLEHFDVKALILVGIAAGNVEGGVKLGDAVGSIEILDVAGGRLELLPRDLGRLQLGNFTLLLPEFILKIFRSTQPRWTIEKPSGPIVRNFEDFSGPEFQSAFASTVSKILEGYNSGDAEVHALRPANEIKYHHGRPIASGEQLVADGSIIKLARIFNDKLGGVEMEGAGFSYTCNYLNVPWFVFRGISDYGDPRKTKAWQKPASVAAAVAARGFLEHGYDDDDEDSAF